MTDAYQPEMGQLLFGNPTSQFACRPFVTALLLEAIGEIETVFWNMNQRRWDRREDPKIPGVEFRPYCWDEEDEAECAKPNFKWGGAEIRWYKHPGRGMSTDVDWTPAQWAEWFDSLYAHVWNAWKESDTYPIPSPRKDQP